MSDAPGEGCASQRYAAREIGRVARDALPFVRGAEAGKVYCPCCRLREARWRRHFDETDPDLVHLFVYCTQCHKTGITDARLSDLDKRGWRGWRGAWAKLRALRRSRK